MENLLARKNELFSPDLPPSYDEASASEGLPPAYFMVAPLTPILKIIRNNKSQVSSLESVHKSYLPSMESIHKIDSTNNINKCSQEKGLQRSVTFPENILNANDLYQNVKPVENVPCSVHRNDSIQSLKSNFSCTSELNLNDEGNDPSKSKSVIYTISES